MLPKTFCAWGSLFDNHVGLGLCLYATWQKNFCGDKLWTNLNSFFDKGIWGTSKSHDAEEMSWKRVRQNFLQLGKLCIGDEQLLKRANVNIRSNQQLKQCSGFCLQFSPIRVQLVFRYEPKLLCTAPDSRVHAKARDGRDEKEGENIHVGNVNWNNSLVTIYQWWNVGNCQIPTYLLEFQRIIFFLTLLSIFNFQTLNFVLERLLKIVNVVQMWICCDF